METTATVTGLLLVFALLVFLMRHAKVDTCLVLYGGTEWDAFVDGFRTVIPSAEVILVSEPGLDFVVYADALQDCVGRYKNVACQVPSPTTGEMMRKHVGKGVAVASDPRNMNSNLVCNIVASEQSLVNAMMKHVPKVATGKRLLISAATCRTPPGWTQVQENTSVQTVLQAVSSLAINVVMISNPALSTLNSIYALKAAFPSAVVLAATTHDKPMAELVCQVSNNRRGSGLLAACMLRLGTAYKGQQTLVVEPTVIKPSTKIHKTSVTSLDALRQMATVP